MYLIIGLDKAAWCKQNEFEKHLDVCDIHLKIALNSHVHKLYKPKFQSLGEPNESYNLRIMNKPGMISYLALI